MSTENKNGANGIAREETIQEYYDRCEEGIKYAFQCEVPVLVEAMPAMGKSYGIIAWAAKTGKPLTVFTSRRKLFQQYANWCEEWGLTYLILPSFHRDCETAKGDFDKDEGNDENRKWSQRVLEAYDHNEYFAGELHNKAEDLFGEPLPCQREGECSYLTARDFDPDDYDVLIGHYRHAHVPVRVEGRYVAFDEFPDGEFLTKYDSETVSTAVSDFLSRHEGLPFDYLKNLKEYRRNPEMKQEGALSS